MATGTAKNQGRTPRPSINLNYVTDFLVAMLTDGFNQLPRYRVADYRADVATVRRRVKCEGLYFVVKILPDLIQTCFDRLEGRTANFSGVVTRDGLPVFLGHVIRSAIAGESVYIRFLYQFCVCFKKTEDAFLGDTRKEEKRMWKEYQSADADLHSVDILSDEYMHILQRARHYAKMFSKDLDLEGEDVIPRPGPGATKTHRPAYLRYVPKVRFAQLNNVFPYSEWFYPRPSKMTDIARSYLGHQRQDEQPRSRYKAVPKTATKLRGICIEENEVQYLQQGVRRALTLHINRHPLYRRRIVLADQSVNGWMAKESSISRSFATIDMKDASDRVARELVSWLFQDNKDVHDKLMALSTRFVSPPIGVKEKDFATAKYAPMGSAVCFPIMSLVFMFLIRAAISTSTLPNPHFLSTNVFVYGDDIVIPSCAYDVVVKTLQHFGMVVNLTKSFVNSHFRESCGVHAYNGMDVTPVYARKFPIRRQLTSMRSLIETEHQLYEKAYFCTASVIRAYGSKMWPKYLAKPLYVVPTSSVIGWKRVNTDACYKPVIYSGNNRQPKVLVDVDHQRTLVRAVVLYAPPIACSLIHGSDAMLHWIALKPEQETADGHLNGDTPSFELLKTKRCWEPSEHVLNAVFPPPRVSFTASPRAVK